MPTCLTPCARWRGHEPRARLGVSRAAQLSPPPDGRCRAAAAAGGGRAVLRAAAVESLGRGCPHGGGDDLHLCALGAAGGGVGAGVAPPASWRWRWRWRWRARGGQRRGDGMTVLNILVLVCLL